MKKHFAFRTALLCAVVVAGCARDDAGRKAGSKTRALTTAEVMEQVARAKYQPPADGRFTEAQVRMYLEVKGRAQAVRGGEQAQEPAAADLRAALELGHNPKELGWVEERVLEAWIALRGQELDRKLAEARTQVLRDLEAQRKSATDPQQRKELEKEIADIRAAAPMATEVSPAVHHNAALVRRFEADVARVLAEDRGSQEARNEP